MVHQFRVTKYDPAHRDSHGAYRREEWTSFGDIGRRFSGRVLTQADYDAVEDAYVASAIGFLKRAGVDTLTVCGLENAQRHVSAPNESATLGHAALADALRDVLRETFWCRFEASNAFIHVGWDYYMYVGVMHSCKEAQKEAERLGLFVETLNSPYR